MNQSKTSTNLIIHKVYDNNPSESNSYLLSARTNSPTSLLQHSKDCMDLDSSLFFREKLAERRETPVKDSARISRQPRMDIEELNEELLGEPIRSYS
jgi:hypothetical protein